MAGRKTVGQSPVARTQLPSVSDAGTQRALDVLYSAVNDLQAQNTTPVNILRGAGSPESRISAAVGSLYLRSDGGAGTTLYVKEADNLKATGWVAK